MTSDDEYDNKYESCDYNFDEYDNIQFIKCGKINLEETVNKYLEEIETEYILNTNIIDIFNSDYSQIMIDYLDNNPTCDLASCTFYSQTNDQLYIHTYEKNTILFQKNINKEVDLRVVWRNNIKKILGIDYNAGFVRTCINNNLNVISASSEPLYTIIM